MVQYLPSAHAPAESYLEDPAPEFPDQVHTSAVFLRPRGITMPGCYSRSTGNAPGVNVSHRGWPEAVVVAFRRLWLALCLWESKGKIDRSQWCIYYWHWQISPWKNWRQCTKDRANLAQGQPSISTSILYLSSEDGHYSYSFMSADFLLTGWTRRSDRTLLTVSRKKITPMSTQQTVLSPLLIVIPGHHMESCGFKNNTVQQWL